MAGHSKWANIKHKKAREDERRGKAFSKLSRQITVAARQAGDDLEYNAELRLAIQKAKDSNMPNENIERAIKRGAGELEGFNYEQFNYEGYGPGGAAIYLELMSDNRNRTASEIRHIFSQHGGSLGEDGCVAWMFERKGSILLEIGEADEDTIFMEAIEAGAEEIDIVEGKMEISTPPKEFEKVRQVLREKYKIIQADLGMMPVNSKTLDRSSSRRVLKLIEALEDHDDVSEVYSNFDIPEEIMNALLEED